MTAYRQPMEGAQLKMASQTTFTYFEFKISQINKNREHSIKNFRARNTINEII